MSSLLYTLWFTQCGARCCCHQSLCLNLSHNSDWNQSGNSKIEPQGNEGRDETLLKDFATKMLHAVWCRFQHIATTLALFLYPFKRTMEIRIFRNQAIPGASSSPDEFIISLSSLSYVPATSSHLSMNLGFGTRGCMRSMSPS